MAAHDYHFVTYWSFDASLREVYETLQEPLDLPRWWPAVYLAVRELRPKTHDDGRGRRIDLWTKGFLPYTLRWHFEVSEVRDDGFALVAGGDFEGRGNWHLAQRGPRTYVTYDWRIRAEKPLLRALSPVLKPVFSANHDWAMRTGEQSLRLELARRRASSEAERAAIPAPPGATWAYGAPT